MSMTSEQGSEQDMIVDDVLHIEKSQNYIVKPFICHYIGRLFVHCELQTGGLAFWHAVLDGLLAGWLVAQLSFLSFQNVYILFVVI